MIVYIVGEKNHQQNQDIWGSISQDSQESESNIRFEKQNILKFMHQKTAIFGLFESHYFLILTMPSSWFLLLLSANRLQSESEVADQKTIFYINYT